MSTKTNFKRVALVAVAALGLGVLTSVAPANAAMESADLLVSSSSLGVCASDSSTGTLTTVAMSKSGSLIITFPASAANDTIKSTGVLSMTAFTSDAAGNSGAISVDQKKFTIAGTTSGSVTFTPSGVGAATIYTQTGGAGANVQTVSVTVLDSCAGSAVPSAATSFVQVIDTATQIQLASQIGGTTTTALTSKGTGMIYATLTLDTSVDQATSFNNGATAYIHALARDAYTLPLAGTAYYYGIACTGDVVVNGGTTNGGFIAGEASKYIPEFSVAQGTLNTGLTTTCSITVNNVVIGTKSITFRGDLAKITSTLYAGGTSGVAANGTGAGIIQYTYLDAAGNRLATTGTGLGSPSLTATGSALINAIADVSGYTTTSTTTGRVSYNCVGADKSGTVSVVLKRTNAAGATISAPAVAATCSGALDTYTASLDKATYNTGDIATLTIKGLDANGVIVNDFVEAGTGAAITISGMTAVTAPSTTDTFSGGVRKYTYKVDNEAGNYVASVYLPSAGTQTEAATVKVTVGSQGVTNADVLKAIVSLIASINKQIAALQKALLKR
jgi:hypothetical protein